MLNIPILQLVRCAKKSGRGRDFAYAKCIPFVPSMKMLSTWDVALMKWKQTPSNLRRGEAPGVAEGSHSQANVSGYLVEDMFSRMCTDCIKSPGR